MRLPVRSPRMLCVLSLLCLAMLVAAFVPNTARATKSKEVVRVGWFESAFNITDELGRRSGYAYDYQQKIAAYTGWTYEYIDGSWPELLQMLEDGKIDLLSDVSFTDERAKYMLFSALPMGTEQYYLFAAPGNTEIDSEDYATLNGKRVGANKGSVQIGYFRDWAKANGVEAELVELMGTEDENLKDLKQGKIDLYLSLDGLMNKGAAVPVCKVGTSDIFFAASKERSDLLPELNGAMNRVQEEEPYFNRTLYAKYLQTSSTNSYLNGNERAWLAKHGVIRVGYQDNYLALCAKDPDTHELTGALKDCLRVASDCLENAHLDFDPVCYPTSADAMEALDRGEVDCVFPTNLTAYDGETRDVFVTPALMSTDMSAVIRQADKANFAKKERITVAVNTDNPNYDIFLLEHFPDWRAIYFADTQECLKAVANGQADCLLVSNYRYSNIARQCEQYGLTTWSTGVEIDYCLAVSREDTTLYSILAKAISGVPPSTANSVLAYYYTEDNRISIADSLRQNLLVIALVVACVLVVAALVIAFLLLRGTRPGKRGSEQEEPTPTKEDFVLFDDLPISYSVYHVTHAEHSELYDAEIVYVNRRFERLGGLPAEAILGHRVRELYPHIEEEWFQSARRAALDGETAEYDYVDPLSGKTFRYSARQVMRPGYCAVTYL